MVAVADGSDGVLSPAETCLYLSPTAGTRGVSRHIVVLLQVESAGSWIASAAVRWWSLRDEALRRGPSSSRRRLTWLYSNECYFEWPPIRLGVCWLWLRNFVNKARSS